MANCQLDYNCAGLSAYNATLNACGAKARGAGFSFIGLVACGTTIANPSSASEINAKIASEDIVIISNIKGGFDDPSAISQDSITSCSSAITINYNRSVTLFDYKVSPENTTFYNEAKARQWGGFIIWECETDGLDPVVSYVDEQITLESFRVNPNTNEQSQYYNVKLSYKSYDDPNQYDAPVGVNGVDA